MSLQPADNPRRLGRLAALALFALFAACQPAQCAAQHQPTPQTGPAPPPPQSSAGEAALPVFELHSGFWLNLHHFLYLQARLAKGYLAVPTGAPETSSDQAPVSLADLSPQEAEAWQAAVSFYARDLADRDVMNSDMENIQNRLKELESCADLAGKSARACTSGLSPDLVDALDSAAPVYRSHWWPAQDRDNRQWIGSVTPMIERMGEQLSDALSSVYEKLWPQQRMRVDVVWYAGPDGAYVSLDPVRVTISSRDARNQSLYGFELLFDEASHAVAGPLNDLIAKQFRDRDKPIPRDLSESLLFYTSGEILQRYVDEGSWSAATVRAAGGPGYVSYAQRFGLYAGPWRQFRGLLDLYWQPYLDGRVSFESAIARMAAAQ